MFDTINNVCDKFNLHSYWSICKDIRYDFQPLAQIPQLDAFLTQLQYYLEQGVKCEHFHELKIQELFLILRWFYSKDQLAQLFYPIIGQSIDFKAFVLDNHLKVKDISELSNLAMMGRSSFDLKFKKEFGIPPGQWLLRQKAKHVKIHMATPGVTISDILIKFDFNSATHFTRFCKQHFGCPPSKMMTRLQNGKY
jgi:AraC-like DNA-binding protein